MDLVLKLEGMTNPKDFIHNRLESDFGKRCILTSRKTNREEIGDEYEIMKLFK
jgi:hypothetical protein